MTKDYFGKWVNRTALKTACFFALAGLGACSDDYELDNEGSYPTWLGNSIYEELRTPNPDNLTGTFTNYLRLVDDLGYTETLSRTGSKTVFAANDEAFERFFQDNQWEVTRYEDLTEAMKKQLLYSSMLDNAILVEMLSNVESSASSVTKGVALRHTTGANVIDTITHIYGAAGMPVNNDYWTPYYADGIDLVMDATRPMMVHFTAEQMTTNNITTSGSQSDFAIITGAEYSEGSAYIFRDKIINTDVTCKNGYIQQMEDVLVPPGNLAELIRTNGESDLFSRMLDRFSAPYFDGATTNNYNDYAIQNGLSIKDSIFQKRYLSQRSQGGQLATDPSGKAVKTDELLPYDPGWNQYTASGTTSNLADIAAMFVPTDEAMKQYFLPGGSGSFLIDAYGKYDNTEANLEDNIDCIPMSIVQPFVSNLMKTSFVGSVPSKFNSVMDDASDPMGLQVEDINKNSEGQYDVKIANNGVAYMLNKVYAPTKYFAVSAPALFSDQMRVINWAIQDETTLGLNFYAYLLAMSANYAFFMPDDKAFAQYYIDPVFLKNDEPRALKFYYDGSRSPYIFCSTWTYNKETGEIGDSTGTVAINNVKAQFTDILNYHTVVLKTGEALGTNKYYKTKHGGEIRIEGNKVDGGASIDNGLASSSITQTYTQQNGTAYRIDHLIQAPQNSVYKTLEENSQFSEFFDLCQSSTEAMSWAGISSVPSVEFNTSEQDKYIVFSAANGLDYNMKFLSTYNYTIYAPNNSAMDKAFAAGLPTWSEIEQLANATYNSDDEENAAKAKAFAMIEAINNFIRYHVQDNSIYADNVIESGTYQTSYVDSLGRYAKLTVGGGNGTLTVTDNRGNTHNISETKGLGMLANKMARDYKFTVNNQGVASDIQTSSFAVVHELGDALNFHTNTDRYDEAWTSNAGKRRAMARWNKFLDAQRKGVKFY